MDVVAASLISGLVGVMLAVMVMLTVVRRSAAERKELEARLKEAEQAAAAAKARLDEAEKHHAARLQELTDAREALVRAFRATGAEVLEKSNEQFLQLANQRFTNLQQAAEKDLEKREERIQLLVEPMQKHLDVLEDARKTAYERLNQQLEVLHRETGALSRAMRDHHKRGKWGELSLERAFEAAGLRLGVDYHRQVILSGDDGRQIPDYVVSIPGGKKMVVDVKTPYDRYDDALAATDVDEQTRLMGEHARLVRGHIKTLRDKDYAKRIPDAMPFVVMFLPIESMLSEALRVDPNLVDHGMQQRVAIATPTTIVAMLSAIAYAWQQEEFAKNCLEIQLEARKLYDALAAAVERVNLVSKRLNSTVLAHNDLISYFDNTVHRAASRVSELKGGTQKALAEVEVVPTPAGLSARTPALEEAKDE